MQKIYKKKTLVQTITFHTAASQTDLIQQQNLTAKHQSERNYIAKNFLLSFGRQFAYPFPSAALFA